MTRRIDADETPDMIPGARGLLHRSMGRMTGAST